MDKKMVPKVRFKGFTDDWEQLELSKMVDVYDGTHQTPKYQKSGIMFLSVENIKTLKSNKYISKEDFEQDFKVYPQKGDILMTRIGDIGTANMTQINDPVAYYVSLALIKPFKINSNFLTFSISSDSVQRDLWKRTLHVAFPKKINKNEIGKIQISFPNESEQISIGKILILVSECITLQQQQLNLYIKLKKGLLQKLFPKNGEMVPEIRFADFTGDWEQRKSGEIFSSTSKKGYPELPVLSVTQDHGVVKRENLNIDIKYDKTTLKNYKLVSNGDFIISLRSFQGGFELSRTRGIVSPAYTVFEFKNPREHNHEFWKNWFKTFKFIQSLKTITFGIRDGKSISFSEFKSLRNTFPADVKEQEQIGNLLEKIDSVINLQHEQLNKLESLKKYLLQKLFI
ncbi:restriction endonuclease subunit S [Companilactobacillus futsaii]|nr:restriction endonuclease subunit S [Companilactobacillus futsaii]